MIWYSYPRRLKAVAAIIVKYGAWSKEYQFSISYILQPILAIIPKHNIDFWANYKSVWIPLVEMGVREREFLVSHVIWFLLSLAIDS